MNLATARTVLAGVVGLVVVGEAIALFLGMQGGGPQTEQWLDANWLNIVADIVFGSVMIVASVRSRDTAGSGALQVAAVFIVLTHALRTIQYVTGRPDAYAFNAALFWANNAQMLGAAGVIALGRAGSPQSSA